MGTLRYPVLGKIMAHPSAIVLLIALFWPSQVWFKGLTEMMVDFPIRLPVRDNLLSHPQSHEFYPNPGSLHLTAWLLSASPSRRGDFLGRLLTQQPPLGELPHKGFTIPVWQHTMSGAGIEKWIPLLPL